MRRQSDCPFTADRNSEPDEYALYVFLGKPRGVVFHVHGVGIGRNPHPDNAIPAMDVANRRSIGVTERTFEIVVDVDLCHVFSVLRGKWNALFRSRQFPKHLAENSEPDLDIVRRQIQATDQTPYLRIGGIVMNVAGTLQRIAHELGQALDVSGTGAALELGSGRGGVADQLVKANGDRLAQVHGAVFLTRGNPHQVVAIGQILVR